MKENRKKEFFICSVAELKMLETHFSRMAAKGWMIDKVNLFSYEYKRIDPQELQFFVDILPQITAFDYPENDNAQEYRRICVESGWTFVAASKQMQLFYTEKKNDMPIPIHTDKRIEAQIMLKTCKKYELIFFFIGLVYLWFMWGGVIDKGFDLFLSNISMSQAISVVVFSPPFLLYFGFILIWYFRTMVHIRKELPAPRVNYKLARIRGMLFSIAAIVVIVVMLTGVVMDICGGAPVAVLAISMLPIAGIFIGLFIRKRIDTKNRERKTNMRMFAVGMVMAIILSIVTTFFVIVHLGLALSDFQSLPEGRIALRLTDFGLETPPNAYNYFSHDSLAVPLNYNYYEISEDGSVRTDVKRVINGYLAYGIFQNLLEEQSAKDWYVVTEMRPDEAKSWGATEGYYLNSAKTDLLLLYERTILQIEYSGENLQADSIQEKAKLIGYQ